MMVNRGDDRFKEVRVWQNSWQLWFELEATKDICHPEDEVAVVVGICLLFNVTDRWGGMELINKVEENVAVDHNEKTRERT